MLEFINMQQASHKPQMYTNFKLADKNARLSYYKNGKALCRQNPKHLNIIGRSL